MSSLLALFITENKGAKAAYTAAVDLYFLDT